MNAQYFFYFHLITSEYLKGSWSLERKKLSSITYTTPKTENENTNPQLLSVSNNFGPSEISFLFFFLPSHPLINLFRLPNFFRVKLVILPVVFLLLLFVLHAIQVTHMLQVAFVCLVFFVLSRLFVCGVSKWVFTKRVVRITRYMLRSTRGEARVVRTLPTALHGPLHFFHFSREPHCFMPAVAVQCRL